MQVSLKDKRLKALNKLAPTDPANVKGLQPQDAQKIRDIITELRASPDLATVCQAHPNDWRCHEYAKPKGQWSIDVKGSTRLLFNYDKKTHTISGMVFDDPH